MSVIKEINLEFEPSSKTKGTYLVFDLETTGLPINRNGPPDDFKNWPYIIQIAWLLFDDENKLIEHKDFYVKQSVEIPISATQIHGMTTTMMLEKGKDPKEVYQTFKKVIDNTEYLICHNIDFEIPVINCEFLRNELHYDFSGKKQFCTMKSGASFCKIPPLNKKGEYKWPKLSELYAKCFFPDHVIKNISGSHNASIDAAMTAQCFFKLKELSLLKEAKPGSMEENVSYNEIKQNSSDLHSILDKWDSDNCYWSYYRIEHKGLGTSRVIRDDYTSSWGRSSFDNPKIAAQFKKWDEQWDKLCQKKKAQAEKEASLTLAEERTKEAQANQKQIDDLLVHTLNIDDTLNWDLLKDIRDFEVPNPKQKLASELNKIIPPIPPVFDELPKEPDKGKYEPKLSFVDKTIKPLKEKKIREANTLYQETMGVWKRSVEEIQSHNSQLQKQYEQSTKDFEEQKEAIKKNYDNLEKSWKKEKEDFYNNQNEYNNKIEKLKNNYSQRDAEAVIQYCEMVLNNSQYPETFPKDFDLDYNSDNKLLIVEYILPPPDVFPTLKEVRYIASKKEMREMFISETQLSKNFNSAIYKIALRTLHELFEADKIDALESIVFNGWVNSADKATGKMVKSCIISVQSKKAEFETFVLSAVDPKACFKHLKGIGSAKLINITPIQPIVRIDNNTKFTS